MEKDDKLLLLRVAGSNERAAPFLYTEQHSVCLKLNNEVNTFFYTNIFFWFLFFNFEALLSKFKVIIHNTTLVLKAHLTYGRVFIL